MPHWQVSAQARPVVVTLRDVDEQSQAGGSGFSSAGSGSTPPPFAPMTGLSGPSLVGHRVNLGEVKSLWPVTMLVIALFAANLVGRFLIILNATEQVDTGNAFLRSRSASDLAKLQDLDSKTSTYLVIAVATWIGAAVVLAIWGRLAMRNHVALGHSDDRPFSRRNKAPNPSSDFAG